MSDERAVLRTTGVTTGFLGPQVENSLITHMQKMEQGVAALTYTTRSGTKFEAIGFGLDKLVQSVGDIEVQKEGLSLEHEAKIEEVAGKLSNKVKKYKMKNKTLEEQNKTLEKRNEQLLAENLQLKARIATLENDRTYPEERKHKMHSAAQDMPSSKRLCTTQPVEEVSTGQNQKLASARLAELAAEAEDSDSEAEK